MVWYPPTLANETEFDSIKKMTSYNRETKQQWVVVYGDMFEGFQRVVGPFVSEAKADSFGAEHTTGNWATFQIEVPDE